MPALRIDGRRIQGSREISRALDELQPEPRLLPSPAVEAAERWGEAALQPLPRRMFRWGAVHRRHLRRWIAGDVVGMPAPAVMAELNVPIARMLATRVGARDESVRAAIAQLPALLDRVDALIAEGTIGGDEPNAADFQIGTTRPRLPGLRGPARPRRGPPLRRAGDAASCPTTRARSPPSCRQEWLLD